MMRMRIGDENEVVVDEDGHHHFHYRRYNYQQYYQNYQRSDVSSMLRKFLKCCPSPGCFIADALLCFPIRCITLRF